VAVVGASGSGKSSVVFAGLIPALLNQEEQAQTSLSLGMTTSHWVIDSLRPDNDPIYNLALALIRLLNSAINDNDLLAAADDLAEDLNKNSDILIRRIQRIVEKTLAVNLLPGCF
jgi:hypothetical protein